jgi:hypothetical protein
MSSSSTIVNLIQRIKGNRHNSAQFWQDFTRNLEHYLVTGDLDLYLINNVQPPIFTWPQDGAQNKKQLEILQQDPISAFYKTLRINNYGPTGIRLYNNIQLDRVQQVWSLYKLVRELKFSLDQDEIIFEFGAGTGQMADVLADMKFKGKHIIYDLPLMTVLQKYFIDKRRIRNTYLLDQEDTEVINATNFLPCNQPQTEQRISNMPHINFIATYSLTEADLFTRRRFSEYMVNFDRIFIVYWPGKNEAHDQIDNAQYIDYIQDKISSTHHCFHDDNFGNGRTFMAVKKNLY